ncbi:MAG: 50S ribosomal protein L3 [Kiritimatiellae bacterium]|nr:50S ribosomal protein L3 [Kiritimatiellia bacterium]
MEGLIGKKVGMTQVWDGQGRHVPVTVLEVGPCPVVQVKHQAGDGYEAAQLGFGPQKPQRLTKAVRTRFEKAGVMPCRALREFRLEAGDNVKAGETLTIGVFDGVKLVDVTAISKGRGFAGPVRRHGMAGGPLTHGGHSKRRIGSIGERNLPGWVRKGKPMPGHMGAVRVTARNLEVVQLRKDDNLLLVRGAVPGPAGAMVIVRKALKKA